MTQRRRFAEGGALGDDYNTVLSPTQEQAFQIWKSQNAPDDSGADYDLRGAYLANMQRSADNGHMGDQFKKPNHPTFSNQSQYAVGDQRDRAGFWVGPEGPDQTFVPPTVKARGGRTGYADGGTPTDQPVFDPSQPFQAAPTEAAKPAFDPNAAFSAAPPTRSTLGDVAAEGGKGLARGTQNLAGDLGEAVMGPFGPSHHFGNLMADLGLSERPKETPGYGAQMAHASGTEAAPQTTLGKYASSIGEVL